MSACAPWAGLRLYEDREVKSAGGTWYSNTAPTVGADRLHQQGYLGDPVTIAVLDTGSWYSNTYVARDTTSAHPDHRRVRRDREPSRPCPRQ